MAPEPTVDTVRPVTAERDTTFRAFYAETYPAVAGYCWSLVNDHELAHDLAQEAFARTFGRWISVREPRAYIFLVAGNLCRAAWRRRSRDVETVVALAGAPDEHEAGPELRIGVRTAVESLPRRLRDVVLLYYFADLPVPEVAAALRRPVGTVKRQLAEARSLLATELEGAHG